MSILINKTEISNLIELRVCVPGYNLLVYNLYNFLPIKFFCVHFLSSRWFPFCNWPIKHMNLKVWRKWTLMKINTVYKPKYCLDDRLQAINRLSRCIGIEIFCCCFEFSEFSSLFFSWHCLNLNEDYLKHKINVLMKEINLLTRIP